MNEDEFVKQLSLTAPVREDFKYFNVSDDYIQNFIKKYKCILRKNSKIILNSNSILQLLTKYDCSNVEISAISFLHEPIEYVGYYQIGIVDIDILAINKISLGIEVLDHDNTDYVIWECASNSDRFLESLLLCAKCLMENFKKPPEYENSSELLKCVNKCSNIAGGDEYSDFYKMLLGYFE
jgi:hypothetical protein